MDSLTHVALGAAVGMAAIGRRSAAWKAALWGSIANTLPDLDVLIRHGDPLSDMVLHRGHSHALFWLTLAAPLLAVVPTALGRDRSSYRHWWLATWLALVTHPLLDLMTVYGTQLLRPFNDHPFAVGSLFIIDPLYTLPVLVGAAVALVRRGDARGLRWNAAGLLLSTAYLAWAAAAQQIVQDRAVASLARRGVAADRLLVTPTPLNTVLWRVVAVGPDGMYEGFHSLLDASRDIRFDRFDAGAALRPSVGQLPAVQRLCRFSQGLCKLSREGDDVLVTDLRMGQEPNYVFAFVVARGPGERPVPLSHPQAAGRRPETGEVLDWLGRRLLGQPLPPPR